LTLTRVAALAVLLICACQGERRPAAPPALVEFAGKPDSAKMVKVEDLLRPAVDSIIAHINRGSLKRLCGSKPTGKPRELLFITAEHCLGCRTVGYSLRHLVSDSTSVRFYVGIPESDSQPVCDFFRAERVPRSIGVVALPRPLLGDTMFHRIAMYVRLDDAGRITSERAGVDILQLLQSEDRIARETHGSSVGLTHNP